MNKPSEIMHTSEHPFEIVPPHSFHCNLPSIHELISSFPNDTSVVSHCYKLQHSPTQQNTTTIITCASRMDMTFRIGIPVLHAPMIGVNLAIKKVVTIPIGNNMTTWVIRYAARQGTRLETYLGIDGQGKHKVVEQ